MKNENIKNAKVGTAEIKKLLNEDIKSRKNAIRRKEEEIRQLQNEIEIEKIAIEEVQQIITAMDKQI